MSPFQGLGPWAPCGGERWGPFGHHLGSIFMWGPCGTHFGSFATFFILFGSHLDPFGALLGPFGVLLDPCWALGPILRDSFRGIRWGPVTHLEPKADFWGVCVGRSPPTANVGVWGGAAAAPA